jgi:hypothetical protein
VRWTRYFKNCRDMEAKEEGDKKIRYIKALK